MDTRGLLEVVPTPPAPAGLPVATRPAPRVCTKCHQEPRDPGQRWGKRCRTAWRREARRLARMRRGSTFTQTTPQRTLGHTRLGRGVAVRLAALEAAACTLLDVLPPETRDVLEQVSDDDGIPPWAAVLGIVKHYTASVLAPRPRST